MKHVKRLSLVVLMAAAGAGFRGEPESRSAEELQALAQAPAVESPPVSLFRGGPRRTGSIAGRIAIEHPKVLSIIPTDGDPGDTA
jgi:hypothetical protein